MLVDSHCHLDFPTLASELDQVIERARAAGIGRLVTISTRVRLFSQVHAITERFDEVYCSVGTHPHHAAKEPDVTVADLVAATAAEKVVAIGEAGLDYHYDNSPRDTLQRHAKPVSRLSSMRAMLTTTSRASWRRRAGRAYFLLFYTASPAAPISPGAVSRWGATCRSPEF
jgi:hypothetical protein